MAKEVRSLKHTYVCSEKKTVVHCALLMQMEMRAPWTSASTSQESCRHWTTHVVNEGAVTEVSKNYL